VQMWSTGEYIHAPDWYRNFRYAEESARGLDCDEDLATPGELRFELSDSPALWLLAAGPTPLESHDADALVRQEEARRAAFRNSLLRAAESYLVARGDGRTIIAGYPWFSDWGRDTFIALRGLCITTGRLSEARSILLEWADAVSQGMLPNRFADRSEDEPEFNSVDASLWYVVSASEFLDVDAKKRVLSASERATLESALRSIVLGYARGTRFGIRSDTDGLLRAGAPLSQLTWMDAKVGQHVVTPRSGKPVEVQALWLNALHVTRRLSSEFSSLLERAQYSFVQRFWNPSSGALYDVVDVNHEPGTVDPSLRPNQIFAAGGLPYTPLAREQAKSVVDVVERALWTPLGLRSLDPASSNYRPRYEGDIWSRDTAYHQGTVWPWLLGAFVEAWVRARGGTREVKREARSRFLLPIEVHRSRAGVGHVSEIADAEWPFTPRGCPFQAWSLAELIRLEFGILADG
ncbi:MAG TPA: amylo-alpha-1,6-glucosidase, partial [Polyangiaceae bacterium]|nr:amylo-alpha-1,6-glucosidase [Polyangiaceae bacterium]